jgi:predicted hydrocarbon binding protein
LFDDHEINLFSLAGRDYEEYSPLISSFSFADLASLIAYCETTEDSDTVKLGVQQVLCATVALLLAHEKIEIWEYHLLANFSDMTEEVRRIRESYTKLSGLESRLSYIETEEPATSKREFEWYKMRGMLINSSDGSRNIAFKVETFVNILASIYEGMVENLVPKDGLSTRDVDQMAKSIIFESGYLSGSKFGWTMHELYQQERKLLELKEKVEKWCAFDSDVGFGMLSLDGEIEREEKTSEAGHRYDDLALRIKLTDNFIVYKQETWQVNLCSFMCGYIQGVLEKITGQPLQVTHEPHQCEQFVAHQTYCMFEVKTNVEKLLTNLDAAKTKYTQKIVRLAKKPEGLLGDNVPSPERKEK